MGGLSPLTASSGGSGQSATAGDVITRVPLLELAATNLLLQSATFSNASWTKTNVAVGADTTAAPNGVVEADTLTDNSAAAIGTVVQAAVIANNGTTWTASCYFTAGTSARSRLSLALTGGTAVTSTVDFSPVTGAIIAQSGALQPVIETLSINSVPWFRVSVSAANNTSGNTAATVTISPDSATVAGVGTVIAWSAQLENTAAATGFIPTTTATVARTAGKVPSWILDAQTVASFSARGIDCTNNTATPNTQFDMDADEITLRTAAGATALRIAPGAAITNNVSTAGPVANGRDQAGAFGASSWIHFYWIWDGTTLATISSAVAPPTGPTLPAGYTYFAYAGAVRFGAGSTLQIGYIRGNRFFNAGSNSGISNQPLAGGAAVVETAVSLVAFIPPNALSFMAGLTVSQTADAAGATDCTATVRVLTGYNFCNPRYVFAGLGNLSSNQFTSQHAYEFPNVGQNLFYLLTNGVGTGAAMNIDITSYKIPNGSE